MVIAKPQAAKPLQASCRTRGVGEQVVSRFVRRRFLVGRGRRLVLGLGLRLVALEGAELVGPVDPLRLLETDVAGVLEVAVADAVELKLERLPQQNVLLRPLL